jgi:hypothetical protein
MQLSSGRSLISSGVIGGSPCELAAPNDQPIMACNACGLNRSSRRSTIAALNMAGGLLSTMAPSHRAY